MILRFVVWTDVPENTMLTHDFVVSIHRDGGYQGGNGWKGNDIFYTFLRLRDAADIDKVNDKIQRVIEKYTPARFDDWKLDFNVIPLVKYRNGIFRCAEALGHIWIFGVRYLFCRHHELYADIYRYPKSSCQRGWVCINASGASAGNIFGMFLAETGILVVISVLLSLLLIVNAREIIEDLLSVHLSSLLHGRHYGCLCLRS